MNRVMTGYMPLIDRIFDPYEYKTPFHLMAEPLRRFFKEIRICNIKPET